MGVRIVPRRESSWNVDATSGDLRSSQWLRHLTDESR
jgi:hypothetical protein